MSQSRRDFLKTTSLLAAGSLLPSGILVPSAVGQDKKPANQFLRVGAIGTGSRGSQLARGIPQIGSVVALADVDLNHANRYKKQFASDKAEVSQEYRKVLDRKDIDAVVIATPDHWHTKICIEALQAGKHVYCEKPLTLTIEEGQILCKAVKDTGKVLQVGTQQRSEYGNKFLTAVAMVQGGRIGKLKRVTCAIGGAPRGGPFKSVEPPEHLDWEKWLGQCPLVDYIPKRCHYEFRWWYEYSGGKMTDWGAHHVDIAQWAMGADNSGPSTVEVVKVQHPVPFKNGYPEVTDSYNTATAFQVRCMFDDGVELLIRNDTENGITFEGEKGSFFVSRGGFRGEAVDELKTKPIEEKELVALRKGKKLGSHFQNFAQCVSEGGLPVSDVFTHHRAMTTCHLANIAMRLGRNLKWNPKTEKIEDDADAAKWVRREQRKGYEIKL